MKRGALSLAILGSVACIESAGPSGPFAHVQGIWTYSGTQTTPALTLSGTLSITQQSGDVIEGSLTWSESDGIGGPVLRSASVAGVVVGLEDVDFEAALDASSRRHLARISANGDTLVGVWVTPMGGAGGSFLAIRSSP